MSTQNSTNRSSFKRLLMLSSGLCLLGLLPFAPATSAQAQTAAEMEKAENSSLSDFKSTNDFDDSADLSEFFEYLDHKQQPGDAPPSSDLEDPAPSNPSEADDAPAETISDSPAQPSTEETVNAPEPETDTSAAPETQAEAATASEESPAAPEAEAEAAPAQPAGDIAAPEEADAPAETAEETATPSDEMPLSADDFMLDGLEENKDTGLLPEKETTEKAQDDALTEKKAEEVSVEVLPVKKPGLYDQFDAYLDEMEKKGANNAASAVSAQQSIQSGGNKDVIDDFDEFIRLMTQQELQAVDGPSSPSTALRSGDNARAMEEAIMASTQSPMARSVAEKTLDQVGNPHEEKEKPALVSFFESITGGSFVKHSDAKASIPNNDGASIPDSQTIPTTTQREIAELNKMIGDSDLETSAPYMSSTAEKLAQQSEYEELVESLTTKIRLLEREKESLRNAIGKQTHIQLP